MRTLEPDHAASESRPAGRRGRPDDVRRAHPARRGCGRGGRGHFGNQVLRDGGPSLGPDLRGTEPRADGAHLRPRITGRARVSRGGRRACSAQEGMRMNATQRGLGRGLGSLIPTGHRPRAKTCPSPGRHPPHHPRRPRRHERPYFDDVSLDAISRNPRQPRTVFDEDALAELVASIREVGLLQPVVVRPPGRRPLRAHHGRATVARCPGRRAAAIPAIVEGPPTTPCCATPCSRTCTGLS